MEASTTHRRNRNCLFCRGNTGSSRSVEHIVPESLGNKHWILPAGTVCDTCNNYFARKVEAPFLASSAIAHLRFQQEISNKRGRIPEIRGVITPNVPAVLRRNSDSGVTLIEVPGWALQQIAAEPRGTLVLEANPALPSAKTISRFMAKVALEALANRLIEYPEGVAYLCAEHQLDDLRDHARRGRIEQWPVHIRTLYPALGAVAESDGKLIQIVHEAEFLQTEWGEWFFSLAIFGVEFTINLGGPEIDGYLRWLSKHNGQSPLYGERYGGAKSMPKVPEGYRG